MQALSWMPVYSHTCHPDAMQWICAEWMGGRSGREWWKEKGVFYPPDCVVLLSSRSTVYIPVLTLLHSSSLSYIFIPHKTMKSPGQRGAYGTQRKVVFQKLLIEWWVNEQRVWVTDFLNVFYYFLNHNSYQRFQVKATSISKLALRPTFMALLRLSYKFSLFTHNKKLWTKSFGSHTLAIFAVFVCLTSAFSINLLWVRWIQKYAQQKGPDGCVDPRGDPLEREALWTVLDARGLMECWLFRARERMNLSRWMKRQISEVLLPEIISKTYSASIESHVLLTPRITICPYVWNYQCLLVVV